jgi:hypothetical protein
VETHQAQPVEPVATELTSRHSSPVQLITQALAPVADHPEQVARQAMAVSQVKTQEQETTA